jgi:hypothetical protein
MKTLGIIKKLGYPVLICGLGGLLLSGVSAASSSHSSSGFCAQDEPGASTVLKSAGPQSCNRINGQFGCDVKHGKGTCTVYDDYENVLFTVESEFNNEDGLSWSITTAAPLAAKVNSVIVKSSAVQSGNACDYIYGDEAVTGSGQGWFREIRGYGSGFANVQTAWFCTDGQTDDTPPPDCRDIEVLDGTGIDCGNLNPEDERFLISLDPNSPDWNPVECTCNVDFNPCEEGAINPEGVPQGGPDNKCTGDEPLKALPVSFEAINDGTTICRTIGGQRRCWTR